MDVTPKTVREVKFAEKRKGYDQAEVDDFLEQIAVGLEVLHDRLRQAVERAQRAEAAATASEGTTSAVEDDTLRRTLVLAQRTADLAVQEAREQAARVLAAAEQRAQAMLGEAEDLARRVHDEALGDIRGQLSRLEASRVQAQQEVDGLNRWVADHRAHLSTSLKDALSAVERATMLAPAPTSRPIEVPYGPGESGGLDSGVGLGLGPVAAPAPVATPSEPAEASVAYPPEVAPGPAEEEPLDEPTALFAPPRRVVDGEDSDTDPYSASGGPDEQALDEFFEDSDSDDRRFGGRLRRRR